MDAPDISIVVPALNEARNLPALVARIDRALAGRAYEVMIVDDGSRDGTVDVCAELGQRFPVALHVRAEPTGGLSGAVLFGLSRARGECFVVMDADLQHPPEQIPDLLKPLIEDDAEFVLGSRYVPGGQTDGRWGRLRRANSRVATWLARPFAGPTRDPMSGFFALRRGVYARAGRFDAVGYKIGLELMCKCRVTRVREVPIRFGLRAAGESKLTIGQQVRYLEHLSRLYDFCFPRGSPRIKVVIVTGLAWLVAFSLYARLVAGDVNPVAAPSLAFVAAALMTAMFHMRSLRRRDRGLVGARPWIDLALFLLGEWSVCILAADWVVHHVRRASMLLVFACAFGAAAVARWVLHRPLGRKRDSAKQREQGPFTAAQPPLRDAA